MINKNLKNLLKKNLLKPVCFIGLFLTLIILSCLLLFTFLLGGEGRRTRTQETAFARNLRAFDSLDPVRQVLEGENIAQIERRLTRLQRRARGVQEHLSVLKRRRELAFADRRFIYAYESAAREAAAAFPHSAPVAAVAAEAAIMRGLPPSAETAAILKSYALRLSQDRFRSIELAIYVLAGALDDPAIAAGIPWLQELLIQDFSGFPENIRQDLLVNEFLLRANRGDIHGASSRLNNILALAETSPDGEQLTQMAAEFFYDHNNPLRAGALFARLPGEANIARAADALVLAGEIPGARNIWLLLASPEAGSPAALSPARARSLYNLAVSAPSREEEMILLERLLAQRFQPQSQEERIRAYSIIRYTRLLDIPRSIAILDDGSFLQNPLLDLELLRRVMYTMPSRRINAEIWMLLNRHPEEESLFEWAAWYFDHQRLFRETSQVLRDADRRGMSGLWIDLHHSLSHIRQGRIAEGENILREAYLRETRYQNWRIPANLGRIEESRRNIPAAAAYYEAAAAIIANQRHRETAGAAQLYLRLSSTLETLGLSRESRRALETALELDPDNLFIRRELRRLDGR